MHACSCSLNETTNIAKVKSWKVARYNVIQACIFIVITFDNLKFKCAFKLLLRSKYI